MSDRDNKRGASAPLTLARADVVFFGTVGLILAAVGYAGTGSDGKPCTAAAISVVSFGW